MTTELNVRYTDQGREYQLPSGVWVPSVTTILGHFKKEHLQKWIDRVGVEEAERIKVAAGERGTRLHNLCEKYLRKEEIDLKKMSPFDKQLYLNMRPYLERIEPIEIETVLYSEKLRCAGRGDVIGYFDNKIAIIDFKTTEKEKKEEYIQSYFEQETAYSLMREEMTDQRIETIVTILVGPMVSQCFIKNRNSYVESFITKANKYHEIFSSVAVATDNS